MPSPKIKLEEMKLSTKNKLKTELRHFMPENLDLSALTRTLITANVEVQSMILTSSA